MSEKHNALRIDVNFHALINNSHDGISLLSAEGKMLYITPSVTRIMGYEKNEIIGADPAQYTHPEDLERVVTLLKSLYTKPGHTENITYRMRHQNGSWRWLQSNITNCFHQPGIEAIVFNYKDITDDVIAEERARRERKNRDMLINNIDEVMWSIDTGMRLITANKAFIDMMKLFTGLDITPGDNLLLPGTFDDETLMRWADRYKKALRGQAFIEEEYSAQPHPRWVEIAFTPIVENGIVVGVACFSKNITQRKLAQEKLLKSEEMMADAQRIAHVGSWELILDPLHPDANKPQWSDEAYRIFGYDPATATASYESFLNRVHPDDTQYAQDVVNKAIAEGSSYALEHRIILPDGTLRWVSSEGEVVADPVTGQPFKIVGTNQDITERKLLEQERENITADLMQRNKDLEQFAYIVSHNLRAPVSNIIGLAEVLQTENESALHAACLDELQLSVKRLDMVIRDLNHILKLKREITEHKERVAFSDVVKDIKESISYMIRTQKAIIETDFSAIDECYTLKSYLYSVFYNLITNSIKYHRPGVPPHIVINSTLNGDTIELAFTDNGLGIDLEKNNEKVFGLYKRFHTNIEGKGMGLFMTKTQIEALGGSISIASTVNQGSTFTIKLKKTTQPT